MRVAPHEAFEEWRGHQGCDNRHDDERSKKSFRNNAALEADIDDDQLHQPARIHQRANAERFAIWNAGGARGQPTRNTFAHHSRDQNGATHQPEETGIQQSNLRVQTRVGEEKREQQRHGERLDPPDEITNHDSPRHRGAHDERAKDCVQSDQIGEKRTKRHKNKSKDEPRIVERAILHQPCLGTGQKWTHD